MRGTGGGVALLEKAFAKARELGCVKMSLTTNTFQAPDFYTKLGFRIVREVSEPVPDVPGNIHYYLEKEV